MSKEWHEVEINREKGFDAGNYVKIDGVRVRGIRNVQIRFGVDDPYPIIILDMYPNKLKARIKGKVVEGNKKGGLNTRPIHNRPADPPKGQGQRNENRGHNKGKHQEPGQG